MSSLRMQGYTMPSASLGEPNPLPDICLKADQHASIPIDKTTVSEEESRYMGWGRVNGILPYLVQDGYNREKKDKEWKAAVLENDCVKAVFLPELGGRLWSLIDKTTGRELLHRNPVFQPCNLALRNAWISGGVEWNVGIIGHTPYTCDHLFAEKLTLDDGTPVLRMYQYERVRRLVYRIEAMLPEGSRYVYIRVRIDNTSQEDTAVYWWSNMALDEREDVRVVVPADKAFLYGYGGHLSKVNIPYTTMDASKLKGSQKGEGELHWDISHTTQLPRAMDFFFDLPAAQRRWIATIDDQGKGFAQTSTDVLQGRKLFVWGMGAGGRNWQTYLSQEGSAYLEIQAGLAHTQLEHLPMKGGETISWMEAYGPMEADASAVGSKDWSVAVAEVEASLEKICPRAEVERMHTLAQEQLDGRVGELLHSGENWAHVQKAVLGAAFSDGGLTFPDAIGKVESPWLELVKTRKMSCPDPLSAPTSYQIGEEWEALLSDTIKEGGSRHWYGYYQYGVVLARAGKLQEADAAFDASIACTANPWAMRCKGRLCQLREDGTGAAKWLKQAVEMAPVRSIAKETLEALSEANQPQEIVSVYATLSADVQELGRLKVLLIKAMLDLGDEQGAGRMLEGNIVLTDVREGEVMLSDLWFRMTAMKKAKQDGVAYSEEILAHVKKTTSPPAHLDFRMN